jgi:hypothetical protein
MHRSERLYRDSHEREKLGAELLQISDEEIDLAKRLHAIVRIGCRNESSNHYYYTTNLLLVRTRFMVSESLVTFSS